MKNLIKALVITFVSVITFSFKSQAQSDEQIVKNYADATAQSLMRKISPNTGYNSRSVVRDWSFNQYSKVLTIKIESYWTAKRYQMASNYETFNIDGTLTIDLDDDDLDFNTTYKNESVRYAWSSSDVAFVYILADQLLSKN